jgi:GT2 family glycosyltransferase
MNSLSVVIPTRNRASQLRRCLASLALARSAATDPVEVVVVDDGSEDDTADVLCAARAEGQVHVVHRHVAARGPAAARNHGWLSAKGSLIAFTDDDCEVDAGWIAALVAAAAVEGPHVAAVGGRVRPAGDDRVSAYMTLHRILEPPTSLRYVVTANCLFRRSALEAVGGFDEAVRAPGGEDPGLCLKLGRLGHAFAYEPSAVVTHHYRPGFREFLRTFYRYGKGCRIVMDP